MSSSNTIVLTGVSRGIGLAIASRLLVDGHHLIGVSRSVTDEWTQLVAANPGRADHIRADLADTEAIPDLVRQAIELAPNPIYGLVNNAGIGNDGLLMTQHATDIEKLIAVNLTAPIMLAKYLARQMARKRRGRIINVTSIVAKTGFSGLSVYAGTKAGLEGFTKSLARELGRVKVTVNNVAPGFIETDMTAGLGESELESIRRRSPLGLVDPTAIAGAVAYLLGPDGEQITGTTLTVDGGSTA